MEQYKTDVWGLLNQLLLYEHQDRLTAKEILLHPYFKVIREKDPHWINKEPPFHDLREGDPMSKDSSTNKAFRNVPMRGQQVDVKPERKMETG